MRMAARRPPRNIHLALVLIIEDNPATMKLASLLLHNAGHATLRASDAGRGLTLACSEQPDLILMDVQLPGVDGLAATALLKTMPASAGIPVIALTPTTMDNEQQRSEAAGCDACIVKPMRYPDLYATIDALLAKKRLAVPSEA